MKLLIVGSDEVWSLEKHYIKYLSAAGVDVKICPLQSIFYKYYYKGIINKVLYKAGLSGIDQTIKKTFQETIEQWNPDVTWVFKGMELTPEVLQWTKDRGVKLVNYNPDNPFIFSGKGSGNGNLTRSIALYDLHLTYDREIKERIEREFNIPCKMLPFGFELSDTLYEECCLEQEVLKACFLGNPDVERAAFINEMADSCKIDVYGNGWSNYVNHPNITVYPAVYGNDFWKILYKYRIQLNLMRPHNPNSHNMRSFEVPGVGGIGLFPFTLDHNEYFENGTEIFLYKDMQGCKRSAEAILNMTEQEVGNVRLAARKKSIVAGYSYKSRALQVLQELQKSVS